MRVVCASSKAKIRTYATALSEAFKCRVEDVPPAYPCDKERLVIIVMSLRGDPSDKLRLFCTELNTTRAFNVALVVDNKEQTRGIKIVKDALRDAGTNVVDDIYYLQSPGIFSGAKITLEERTEIVRWAEKVISNLTNI
jgi:hypothetical protein